MKTQLINPKFENYVDDLLIWRGVKEEDLPLFYNPVAACLEDYKKLDNIETAANKIIEAVEKNNTIGILMDCDVDGWTSSGIMYHYLKEMNPNLNIFTTFHTHKQHGLEDSWERFVDAGCQFVIEPDAGINDKSYHDLLGEQGIFTVVIDHHEYEDVGFSNYATYVDNQISEKYGNKSLAGCGMTWQVCRMIDEIKGTDYAFKYIDLVALGCAADVMSPLTLENRYIFDYGFSHVQNEVFKAIIEKQAYSMKDEVNYTSVAFYVAPLINACMRTGTQEEKSLMYSMMLDPSQKVVSNKRGAKGEIVSIVEECLRILTNVKARQQRLIDTYIDKFSMRIESEGLNDNNIIVIHLQDEDDFDSELNGLLAMKFSGMYHKPCLFIRDGLDNITKGSARNPNGSPITDLKELINQSPYTDFTAGHANAHGVGIKTPCLDKFVDWFNQQTKDLNFAENTYQVNFELTAYDTALYQICYDIAIHNDLWGGNNPQPVVSLKNIHTKTNDMSFMGSKHDTVKLTVNNVDCMFFRSPQLYEEWSNMDADIIVDIVGRPALNIWGGRVGVQLMVDDFEWHENSVIDF